MAVKFKIYVINGFMQSTNSGCCHGFCYRMMNVRQQ